LGKLLLRRLHLDARHAEARLWSAEEVALLGALPDAEVARRTGRSPNAVALKRLALGRPPVRPRRWTPEEDELVRTLPAAEVARKTGRTLVAVWSRRYVLGVPGGRTGQQNPSPSDDWFKALAGAGCRLPSRTAQPACH
jgi:hypothetical protein